MEEAEFKEVDTLRAEALGEPGERTFRMLVDGQSGTAVIWLEKEQLLQLGLAINQLLVSIPEDSAPAEANQDVERAGAKVEFKVGKLVLGHDGSIGKFVIEAHDIESDEDSLPSARVWGDRSQVKAFADQAIRVCAAGRPLCPLCGAPMDRAGHRCPRTNGHGVQDLDDLR